MGNNYSGYKREEMLKTIEVSYRGKKTKKKRKNRKNLRALRTKRTNDFGYF